MSRGFSLAWLLAFTKSFAWLVCRVRYWFLFTPREKWGNKLTTQQTSHANDFVNWIGLLLIFLGGNVMTLRLNFNKLNVKSLVK